MGYFVSGWPKTYLLPQKTTKKSILSTNTSQFQSENQVHSIIPDPSNRYVLTVSKRALYIWNGTQHRVLLARFVISQKVLIEEGPFIDAVWSLSSQTVIAALEKGLVLIFRITPSSSNDNILNFNLHSNQDNLIKPNSVPPLHIRRIAELRVAHTSSTITALTSSIAGALVATSSAQLTCIAWDGDTLWRVHLPELLRRNNALTKMGVLSNMETIHSNIKTILDATPPDTAGGIKNIAYNAELGFCAVVFSSGCALLLALPADGSIRPSAIDGRWLRDSDVVTVALEPRRMLATVGLCTGEVEQYYVGVPAGDRCPLMRRLTLSNWYFEATDVGPVSVLQWTDDGHALVVGWQKKGLAVWSASGCRLMWTLPQVGGTNPITPATRITDNQSQTIITPMEQGVKSAAWGPHGLFLWAAPRCTSDSPIAIQECHFMEFTFYKASSSGSFCHSDSSRLALFGSDRILLLCNVETNSTVTSATRDSQASDDLFSWQHLIIPNDYLWKNWPPERIAVSEDAAYITVAGTYGVAICQVRTQKWRVFGDLAHDRRIRCCALAWVGKTIVVGNEIIHGIDRSQTNKSYELLLYPREHLESSALQAQKKLPSKPVLMDVRTDGYLLVICDDAQVFLFKMATNYNNSRIDLLEVYRRPLPIRELRPMYQQDITSKMALEKKSVNAFQSPPAPGGGISDARIFPPLTHTPTAKISAMPAPTQIMLLRNTGSLILLDMEQMLSTPLLRYVERFWYTPVDCTPFDMLENRPVWWAYGDDGLHVCFDDGTKRPGQLDENGDDDFGAQIMSSRSKVVEVEQWLELDPEVYPLSIMSNYGMLLGATQGLVVHGVDVDKGSLPSHTIQIKRQPILHTLLRHLLMKPRSEERTALQVALKCVPQPQFIDSLEWLLYEAVLEHDDDFTLTSTASSSQDMDMKSSITKVTALKNSKFVANSQGFPESPRRKSAGTALFPRVIRLLKYFGEYEDIVVRCARKLDPKRWPLLFSFAGEPAALLEQCFVSGRLRTAACLLVILQEMWGFISSTPHSLRLVSAALSRGELELAADLANFLSKADRAGMLNSSQLRTTEDVSWIAEAAGAPNVGVLGSLFKSKNEKDISSERIPAIDLAVLNHARGLLNKMELRKLAALAVKMDFPLAEWLRRELKGKNSSKPFVRDFSSTILTLHRQFQFEEPSIHDVRRAMRLFNRDNGIAKKNRLSSSSANGSQSELSESGQSSGDINAPEQLSLEGLVIQGVESAFGSQLPPPPSSHDSEYLNAMREKGRELCRQELTYLLAVARVSRVPDLMLCFATLLLDISILRMVLRGYEELFEPYIAALNEFDSPGYNALVAVLNEIAAPK